MKRSARYDEYLASEAWAEKRERALEHYGRKCHICGRTMYLQVHHRTYVRLGHERMSDLEVLCKGCHARRHHKIERVKGVPWPKK